MLQTHRWLVGVFLVVLALLLAACGGAAEPTTVPATQPKQIAPTAEPATAPAEGPEQPVALDGESLVVERCTVCHGLARIQQASKTGAEWEATVARMVGKGAELSAEEQAAVIQYLAETYGP